MTGDKPTKPEIVLADVGDIVFFTLTNRCAEVLEVSPHGGFGQHNEPYYRVRTVDAVGGENVETFVPARETVRKVVKLR